MAKPQFKRIPKLTQKAVERFWKKVKIGKSDECWPWIAGRSSQGYGTFSLRNSYGRMYRANRIAYALSHKDPGDQCVLHQCDNPPCVNPNHLSLGEYSTNYWDMKSKGRAINHGSPGNTHWNAKLKPAQVKQIRELLTTKPPDDIARKFGMSVHSILKIRNGQRWAHIA